MYKRKEKEHKKPFDVNTSIPGPKWCVKVKSTKKEEKGGGGNHQRKSKFSAMFFARDAITR